MNELQTFAIIFILAVDFLTKNKNMTRIVLSFHQIIFLVSKYTDSRDSPSEKIKPKLLLKLRL